MEIVVASRPACDCAKLGNLEGEINRKVCARGADVAFRFQGVTVRVCSAHATLLREELAKKSIKWEWEPIIVRGENGEHGSVSAD